MSALQPRYAIYYLPDEHDALWAFGSRTIGYDSVSGIDLPFHRQLQATFPDWQSQVAEPSRYGFHATLKAPFELAQEHYEHDLLEAVGRMTSRLPPVEIGLTDVVPLGQYVAVVPRTQSRALTKLQTEFVIRLDEYRAPMSETDRARRGTDRLTERQRQYLDRWGYPFVLDEFRFHMTLAGPLTELHQARAQECLRALSKDLPRFHMLDQVAVVKQVSRTERFRLVARFPLNGWAPPPLVHSAFVLSHR